MRRLLAVALVAAVLVVPVPVATVSLALPTGDATGAGPPGGGAAGPQVVPTGAPDASATVGPSDAAGDPDRARQAGAPNVTSTPDGTGDAGSLVVTDEFDNVEFHITVYANGTAKWTFTYQRTLSNDTEVRQFEAFASEFNNNSTAMWRDFRAQARDLAAAGQNFTGRTMQAQHFRKEAYVGGLVNDNRGIVKMSFQWTWFATSRNKSIIMGDVFQGGLYVGPNQSLVVHSGPGLEFTSVDPREPAEISGETLSGSATVTWQGEQDFTDRRPRVELDPVRGTTTTTPTTTGTGSGGGSDGNETRRTARSSPATTTRPASGENWPPLMMFVGAVVVLLGLAAAFAWRQSDFGSLSGSGGTPGGGSGGNDAGAAASGGTAGGSARPAVSDEELLTDEARVKKLLEENGGRMKQVNIVEETGWSKSKVSMLLSEMEDEGEISKLRVGRENIISLEGHEPDAAGSPLEE